MKSSWLFGYQIAEKLISEAEAEGTGETDDESEQ